MAYGQNAARDSPRCEFRISAISSICLNQSQVPSRNFGSPSSGNSLPHSSPLFFSRFLPLLTRAQSRSRIFESQGE